MMIFMFVVDTSASMSQRFSHGLTLLDCAKSAIEHLVRLRLKDPASRKDLYFLATFEEGHACLKYTRRLAGPQSATAMLTELKMLRAVDSADISSSLQVVFDFLNTERQSIGIDMYAQGRFPNYSRPTFIVTLSDGGSGRLSLSGTRGDPTVEPFRWDYRVLNLFLTSPPVSGAGNAEQQPQQSVSSPLAVLADQTGGRNITVHSLKRLLQTVDALLSPQPRPPLPSLTQLGSGVLVHLEEVTPSGSILASTASATVVAAPGSAAASSTTSMARSGGSGGARLLYVRSPNGVPAWPLPESYWPDVAHDMPPARTALPTLSVCSVDVPVPSHERVPADVYPLDPCAITAPLIKRGTGVCWLVHMRNSGRSVGIGAPFGYLRALPSGGLALYVLPYNFAAFLALIGAADDGDPNTPAWLEQLEAYLYNTPLYYRPFIAAFLRQALPGATAAHNRLRDARPLAPAAAMFAKRMRQAAEAALEGRFLARRASMAPAGTAIAAGGGTSEPVRNAFDIERAQLFDQLTRMRLALVAPQASELFRGALNSTSIAEMGDYAAAMQRNAPPRSPFAEEAQRPLFGNPFKLHKAQQQQQQQEHMMMVDEAEVDMLPTEKQTARGASPPATPSPPLKRTVSRSPDDAEQQPFQQQQPLPADDDDALQPDEEGELIEDAAATATPVDGEAAAARRIIAWMQRSATGVRRLDGGGSERARGLRTALRRRLRSTRKAYGELVQEIRALEAADAAWLAREISQEAQRFKKTALVELLRPLLSQPV